MQDLYYIYMKSFSAYMASYESLEEVEAIGMYEEQIEKVKYESKLESTAREVVDLPDLDQFEILVDFVFECRNTNFPTLVNQSEGKQLAFSASVGPVFDLRFARCATANCPSFIKIPS